MFIDLPPVPSTEIVVASDYVRDGVSLTNGNVAYQGAVTLDAGHVYVRATGTVADFQNVYDADAELRLAVGAKTTIAGFGMDLSATYTNYHGVIAGADNEEVDYRLTASRKFGEVSTAVAVQYNPDVIGNRGEETLIDTRLAFPVGKGAELSGGAGRAFADYGDYTIWNAGVTKNVTETVALDVRYFDSNGEDRFGTAFGDRFVVSLRASF